jgi:hypothetical protein
MTKTEARRTLGVTSSSSYSKTTLVYTEKCRKLRLQMVPGMPETIRHKAYNELAKLNTAFTTLKTAPSASNRQRKQTCYKPPTRRPAPVKPYKKPQTLGEAWEDVAALMPFSEPVVLIIIVVVALLALMWLASAF